jgi:hypothetical protein
MGEIRLGDLVGLEDGRLGIVIGRNECRWMVEMEDGSLAVTELCWKAGNA